MYSAIWVSQDAPLYIIQNTTVYIGSIEQSVYQIYCIILFLINDFGIYLRHLHIGITEQLRGCIEVCPKGKHHRSECVATLMVCKSLVDSRSFRLRLDKQIHHRRTRQIEYMVFCCFISSFRHPLQRFGRKWQINRFFVSLHRHCQVVLSPIDEYVFPLQSDNIAHAQSAKAGKQISRLHSLIIHRGSNQWLGLPR